MKKTSLLITALLTATFMFAYDATYTDNYGNTIYLQFSVTGGRYLEVTNSGSFGSYSGAVEIPSEVSATYFGELTPQMYPVTAIGMEAFRECHGLTKVILPTSITEIQNLAFYECDNLESVIIPGGVSIIYGLAFANCSKLTEVICLADIVPALMDSSAFCTKIDTIPMPGGDEYNYHEIETLKVPIKKVAGYKVTPMWKECFKNIVGIDCGTSVVESLKSTYAEIKWKPAEEVFMYTIDVYCEGQPFAQYILDGMGLEISHQRFAAIHKADTTMNTTDYFVITMDNLTPNTGYSYTIHGTNTLNEQVYQDDGAFKTKSRDDEAIESVTRTSSAIRKVIKDGVMIIEHNGASYSPSGQRQ